MAGLASGDKGSNSVEKDAPLEGMNGYGSSDAAISESQPGELQSTMAEEGSDEKGSEDEAEARAAHNSSWEVRRYRRKSCPRAHMCSVMGQLPACPARSCWH